MAKKLIQSFEEACTMRGISPVLPDVSQLPEHLRKPVLAQYQLLVIAEAQNEGHRFDWNDYNELKYYPWFDIRDKEGDEPGSGFSCNGFGCDNSDSDVGSRLCFRTREEAEHIGRTFIGLYRDLMKQ